MKHKFIPVISAIAAFIVLAQVPNAHGQIYPYERTMSINTVGEVKAWPNVARLKFQIKKENLLAARALEDCKEESKKFLNTLKSKGLDEFAVVNETGIVIASQQSPYSPRQSNIPSGFTASQDFTLDFPIKKKSKSDEALQQIAKILDALNPEGYTPTTFPNHGPYGTTNSVVQYVITNADRFEDEIIKQAVEKNRPEAERKAKIMGVKIKGIRSSNYHSSSYMTSYNQNQNANEVSGSFYQEYPVKMNYSVNYIVEEAD